MAVNRDSNVYTIIFAVVMVLVVGTGLTLLAQGLKPRQDRNDDDKKKIDILAAIKVTDESHDVKRKNAAEIFSQFVKEIKVIDHQGNIVEGVEGLAIDIKKQYRDKKLKIEEKQFPLYVAEKDGQTYHIVPMVGTGLWGPIWGYVALKEDNITIYGAVFDHKTETPGLGAEIKESFFEDDWDEKKIWSGSEDNKTFTSITVRKGGAIPGNPHQVDAITGGTITSNGVDEMARRTFKIYRKYLKPQF